MKFTNSTLCTICIAFCICLSAMTLFPVAAAASDTAATDDFPSGPREYWQVMHNTTDEPPAIYEELWALPEEEQRERIEAMRVTPETRKWPVDKSPVVPVISISFDGAETFELTHPTDWWVSAINPVNNETGNYSEITIIPEIGPGDTIHVWGLPGHTYEGGFAITAADVTIQRWEGAPVMPVLTSPVNTTPAITITGNNATLSGLNVSGTSLSDGNGAGVSAMGTNVTPLEGLTIDGCTFSGNSVDGEYGVAGYGGALYVVYGSDIRILNSILANNDAHTSGGGAYIQESGIGIQKCSINSNSALTGGGGAYFDASDSVISDSTFSENTIPIGDGGGMFFRDGSVTLSNTTVSENIGSGCGGGACFLHLDPEIIDCNFIDNSLEYSGFGDGGGAFFSGCNATLTDTRIAFNEAPFMFCGGGSFYGGNVTLVNSSFISNTGGYEGGATFFSSTALMKETEISGNVADFHGGGLNIHDSDIMMNNCAVDRNGASYGGGVYSIGSQITLINSSLSGNIGIEWGGGAGLEGSGMMIINTTVSGNGGGRGGGIYCDSAVVTAEKSLFSDNTGLSGGAIGCKNGGAALSNTTLINNGFSGDTAVNAIEGGISIQDTRIIGQDEYISSAAGNLDVTNVTFDALEGNTTTISCTGRNIGIGTAMVPPSEPVGNKTIHHALALTGINYTYYGGFFDNNSNCDLKMQYLDSDLDTINESKLMLFSTNGTYWEEIPNTTTNTTENEISVFLTKTDLPESVIEEHHPQYIWNWTTLVPAGPQLPTEETIALSLTTGWNMISSPFEEITSISVPPDVLVMYRYDAENGTYVLCDPSAPCPCRGYWIGATAPCTVNITGIPLSCYSQNLSTGWNMIGCRCHPVPVEEIITTPETTVYLYGYDRVSGQYQWITIADALQPGEGYWAGVGCCCTLTEG